MIAFYHLERLKIMREGIAAVGSKEGFQPLGSGNDTSQFVNVLKDVRVDVLLLDIEIFKDQLMGSSLCLQFCQFLEKERPELPIVLHSPYYHVAWVQPFLDAGVLGFVSKNSGFGEIGAAFRTVTEGEVHFCPEIARLFLNINQFKARRSVRLKPLEPGFTSQENRVLSLLMKGESTKRIATQLLISERTVETHRKHLVEKARVRNTAQLINYVSTNGMVVV